MPLTSKHWAQVKITSTLTGDITIVPNDGLQTFQGMPVPLYSNVDNHVDCGGTVNHYLSVQRSGVAAKNDCPSGQLGTVVEYVAPAGKFLSIVSQADANAKADNDIATNKQAYANIHGSCQ